MLDGQNLSVKIYGSIDEKKFLTMTTGRHVMQRIANVTCWRCMMAKCTEDARQRPSATYSTLWHDTLASQ